jgi:hypothetical protein
MSGFGKRMLGAAKLDPATYEEVEADTSATPQALLVVFLASLASGVATWRVEGLEGLLFGFIGAIVGWLVWAALTYLVGTKILPEPQTESDMGELLRTIGFAASPGILKVLGAVQPLSFLVPLVVDLWLLLAFVVAVRQALDYKSTTRAVVVCLIGFAVYMPLSWFFTLL